LAKIIPEFNPKEPTEGELYLLTLFKKLPKDYLVYYTINVNNSEPDFIVVGKEIGVLIIEVKDWDLTYIKRFDKDLVHLADGKVVRNPLEQANTYSRKILSLSKDGFSYPVNHIVCFCNITYDAFINFKDTQGNPITKALDPQYVIYKDELETAIHRTQCRKEDEGGYGIPQSNHKYVQLLQKKLHHTFKKAKHEKAKGMTEKQIAYFSCALYPQFIIDDDDPMFKALEIEQILIANSIPTEHELIRGNAGTGKSIILQAKAFYIAKHKPDAKILLIYFNTCIKSHLLAKRKEFKRYKNVEIDYHNNWITTRGKYDYILVDEGQDFNDKMLEDLKGSLKEKGVMVISSDGAQNIYEREHNLDPKGKIKSVIDIKKEVKVLHKNYRTTKEIFNFANDFLKHPKINVKESLNEYHSNYYSQVNNHFRHGEIPIVKGAKDFEAEYKMVRDYIQELKSKGERPNNICIVVNQLDYLKKFVARAEGEVDLYTSTTDCRPKEDDVFIYTRHSSKGLEFRYVILCGLEKDAKSKYHKSTFVAMTRAKYGLMIVYRKDQSFNTIEAIKDIYKKAKTRYDKEKDYQSQYKLFGDELMNKTKTLQEIRNITTCLEAYSDDQALHKINALITDSLEKVVDFQEFLIFNINGGDHPPNDQGEIEYYKQFLKDTEASLKKLQAEKNKLQVDRNQKQDEYEKTILELKKEVAEKNEIISQQEIASTVNKSENRKAATGPNYEKYDDYYTRRKSTRRKPYKTVVAILICIGLVKAYPYIKDYMTDEQALTNSNENAVVDTNTPQKIHYKSEMTLGQVHNKYGKLVNVRHSYINISVDDQKINELSGYHQNESTITIEENDNNVELVFNGVIGKYSSKQNKAYEDKRIPINQSVKIMYSNSYNSVMMNDKTYEMMQLKELQEYAKGVNEIEVGKEGDQIVVEYKR